VFSLLQFYLGLTFDASDRVLIMFLLWCFLCSFVLYVVLVIMSVLVSHLFERIS